MGDTMQHDAGGSMNAPAQGAQSVQGAQSAQTTQTEVVTQGLDYRRVAPVIPFSRAGWAQVGMYAILVALACIPGSNAASSATSSLMSFAVGLLVMLFAFFTPLRDGIPGRVIGVILGLLGMIFASTPLLGELVFGMAPPKEAIVASPGTLAVSAWFAGAGALLVTLVVVSFGRQMARLDRSNLIVQLSHMIMDGACTVLCSGWCFLPMLLQGFNVSKTENANGQLWVWLLCVIAVVAFAVVLGFMDRLWYRDAQPLEGVQAPWFGFAMMPVMITGGLVALATLIVQMTLTV